MLPGDQLTKPVNYKSNWIYLLLLLIIVWVAYWPISFHIFSLKNDALNYFLPTRRLVSESYHSGIFPLWTPYLNLGYPLHGDMQSGVWNPVVQLFSLFGPYNLYTLQLETLLYVYLSGVGMFYLLKYFKVHPYANLLASVAFMLCGFNSDSAQFLNWITGASCLPFLFLFYYRLLKEDKIKWALATAITLFVCLTSAYPADFILSAYMMAALFIWNYFRLWKIRKKILPEKQLIISHLVLVFTFLLLASPAILSYMQSLPLTERGEGASYEQVMSNSLHPFLLSSYATPLGIWKMPGIHNTDPLERNSFIGMISFVFLIVSFLIKTKDPLLRFSKWAVAISLLFSFGEIAGLRTVSYYILPFMNTFRHPANAKLFTTFFSCILVAFAFDSFISENINSRKIKTSIIIASCVLMITWICSLFTPFIVFSPQHSPAINATAGVIQKIKNGLDNSSFADLVLINTIIQLPFLYFVWKFTTKKIRLRPLLSLGIVNCILFTMLFQPFTVVKTQKASAVQKIIDENSVESYPIPDIKNSLNVISKGNENNFADIGCRALYNKKIGRSDYRITPSNLLSQNKFWFNEKFKELIMKYPLLYRADILTDTSNYQDALNDSIDHWAFLNNLPDIRKFENDGNLAITITKFYPNDIEGTITSSKNGFLVLLQNYYPRWKLYVDNKREDIIISNISFMGFNIPAGVHQFSFRYEADDIKLAFLISLLALLTILILFLFKPSKLF
jgi:hypothetical protein